MKTITITHQKGGVGKTTIALNLAFAFKDNLKVAILDLDPQRSAQNMSKMIQDKGIEFIPKEDFKDNMDYDVVIIDTPPYLSNLLPIYLKMSDLVIIPTKVGLLDIMAIGGTISLVKEAQSHNPKLKAGILLNMVMRTNFTEEIKDILKEQSDGIAIMSSVLMQRVSYAKSPLFGGVFSTDDEKAKNEISELVAELMEILEK